LSINTTRCSVPPTVKRSDVGISARNAATLWPPKVH
jgi:hypothetical protein